MSIFVVHFYAVACESIYSQDGDDKIVHVLTEIIWRSANGTTRQIRPCTCKRKCLKARTLFFTFWFRHTEIQRTPVVLQTYYNHLK